MVKENFVQKSVLIYTIRKNAFVKIVVKNIEIQNSNKDIV